MFIQLIPTSIHTNDIMPPPQKPNQVSMVNLPIYLVVLSLFPVSLSQSFHFGITQFVLLLSAQDCISYRNVTASSRICRPSLTCTVCNEHMLRKHINTRRLHSFIQLKIVFIASDLQLLHPGSLQVHQLCSTFSVLCVHDSLKDIMFPCCASELCLTASHRA